MYKLPNKRTLIYAETSQIIDTQQEDTLLDSDSEGKINFLDEELDSAGSVSCYALHEVTNQAILELKLCNLQFTPP